MEHFAICSNPTCTYSIPFDNSKTRLLCSYETPKEPKTDIFDGIFETHKPIPFNEVEIQKYLPADRFCEKCGSKLLFYCPRCNIGFFTIAEPIHCKHCGKKIK